ncbi:MAG: hypothetical protein HZB59_11495 [Ignavibacteriales bacterium]|nr:hypothetical protein [Ignavibacteriales bacterium]
MNRIFTFVFSFLFYLQGCFYIGQDRYEDIIQEQSTDWSIRDEQIVIISSIADNLLDHNSPNIKVFATPYYPSVVLALEGVEQRIKHLQDDEYRRNADRLLKEAVGLYMDWENYKFMDARGNYVSDITQIDSMQFLITFENRSWPCNIPVMTSIKSFGGAFAYSTAPIAGLADWPCYMPYIKDLNDRIFLVNDENMFIKPQFIWGIRNNILSQPETVFAMFHFRRGDHHFLSGSKKMYLVIKGFENDIKLSFSLSMMR